MASPGLQGVFINPIELSSPLNSDVTERKRLSSRTGRRKYLMNALKSLRSKLLPGQVFLNLLCDHAS